MTVFITNIFVISFPRAGSFTGNICFMTIDLQKFLSILLVLVILSTSSVFASGLELKDGKPFCEKFECNLLFPDADEFRESEKLNIPVFEAVKNGEVSGYLFLSTDLVNIPAYSGKPLITLIAIDPEGTILDGRVVHHSEPILLVGIPESVLNDFIKQYIGYSIRDRFEIVTTGLFGDRGETQDGLSDKSVKHELSDQPLTVNVDMVTGATVTIQVLDQTLVTSARKVGEALGIIESEDQRIVTWKSDYVHRSWKELVEEGSIGTLRIELQEMGIQNGSKDPWIDLYYGDVSQPVTGINILGESTYNWLMENLEEGEKAIFIAGSGVSTFKGSGFVRGGIFDRFYIEQGNFKITFRDLDYENLYGIKAEGVPEFMETGLFIIRNKLFDSSNKWSFYYVANRLTGETALSKIFKTFHTEYQYPEKYFDLKLISNKKSHIVKIWSDNLYRIILLTGFLLLVTLVFVKRKWMYKTERRLVNTHITIMVLSIVIVGIILKSPPSMAHLYPLIRVFQDGFRMDLYLSDPLQFIFWSFIALTLVLWGRGWFCGWVCPYGSLLELTNRFAKVILPKKLFFDFPMPVHNVLRKFRYGIFFFLVIVAVVSIETAERLIEVEPFKTTWLLGIFSREWYFIGYWFLLFFISIFNYRFFCRYVCPLGAGFSIGSFFQRIRIERRGCCTRCKICARGCDSLSIDDKGNIDVYECYSCFECEQKYTDEDVCPPLIVDKKNRIKGITVNFDDPCKNPDL